MSARLVAYPAAVVIAFGWLVLAAGAEQPPIHLRVSPAVSFSPATLVAQVKVDPQETDRELTVIIEGPDFYRQSSWTIEGRSAPKAYAPIVYRDVPSGPYTVRATVGSLSRIRATASTEVIVR
jgi:hypothetical protein